jgi:phenylalanyl-tRNA synthetase beta chain
MVDLPEGLGELTATLDDLGLVVEAVESIGEGLDDVVVARVEEIRAIEGADRIRLVVADAGGGPIEVVCGASNFVVGDLVPFAGVGTVLPGGFEISRRTMRGVTSNGMLCSGRELQLSEDHDGLLILTGVGGAEPGVGLVEALGLNVDTVLEISPEGNRPDAWCVEGVARDIAARRATALRPPKTAVPDDAAPSAAGASAAVSDPELCGMLTVGLLREVSVGESPSWVRQRLEAAGMRALNNVVDASNYVMLELGQPTHPYDASLVAGRHIGVRRAEPGETLTTLDGVERVLGVPGRGLGDTGIDCVIVDGDDVVIGLAGVMGGASSEISAGTTEVLLEAAFFDPMSIARTVKRLDLRTEASRRFERGVDPTLASRAIARFVEVLRESSPGLSYAPDPVVASGEVPPRAVVTLTEAHVLGLLGTPIPEAECARLLRALDFEVEKVGDALEVTAPARRLDIREGARGRADVIEEIARLYGYGRLERHQPSWPEPGSLSHRQLVRRRLRDALVGLGHVEAWTASLVSDEDFDLVAASPLRVRVTNPLSSDESVLRGSLLAGLARVWGRNLERGLDSAALFEIGTVVAHPGDIERPRVERGGFEGSDKIELPSEYERALALLGRPDDDASTAVATWAALSDRLGLAGVAVREAPAPRGWHPTRCAELHDRASGAVLGRVGELDPALLRQVAASADGARRVGLIELDVDALADPALATSAPALAAIPSRYPSAGIDLAFATPDGVNAGDLAHALAVHPLVESIELFDVFRGPAVGDGARSLAYAVRLSAPDRTLSESEVAELRGELIESASSLGARLR